MNGWNIPTTWSPGEELLSADLNAQLRDNMNFLKLCICLEEAIELTISSGAVTVTQSHHTISAGTLYTINGGSEGDVILIRPASGIVIVKNGTGNIYTGGADINLATTSDYAMLIYNGSTWCIVGGTGVQGGSSSEFDGGDVTDSNNTSLNFDFGGP